MKLDSCNKVCFEHSYGLMEVSGKNAGQFLQGQLTCDVNALSTNGCRGAICNPQGRVYSTFYICKQEDNYWLRMSADIIESTIDRLNKYAVFYQVGLKNLSTTHQVVFAQGNAETVIIHQSADGVELQEYWIDKPFVDEEQLLSSPAFSNHTFNDCEVEDNNWLDLKFIRLGYSEVNYYNIEKYLPHNIGLQYYINADAQPISFNKGCYTGQEIVARMHYRGKVKKSLLRFSTDVNLDKINADAFLAAEVINGSDRQVGDVVVCAQNKNGTSTVELLAVSSLTEDQYYLQLAHGKKIQLNKILLSNQHS